MKKAVKQTITFMLMLFCGICNLQAETVEVEYTISASTNTGTNTEKEWNFQNDIIVSNTKKKGYSTGNEDGVKYSRNVQFTIQLPAGLTVNSITFKGYDNYADEDAYLKEVNGVTYAEDQYVFPKKDGTAYQVAEHTINFEEPVTGEITFTPAGQQVVWVITVKGTAEAAEEDGENKAYTISAPNYVDSHTIGEWMFKNDIIVTNTESKAYSTGLENGIKYSTNVQFVISLPKGFAAKSIIVKGYGNNDENDCYIKELNGEAYTETDYVFAHRIDSKTAKMTTHQIDFESPVTNEISITPGGTQAVWVIIINGVLYDDSKEPANYTIAASKYSESTTDTEWVFEDGIVITNEGGKKYATGNEDGVKFSANVQHTIQLPDNFFVKTVTIKGYDNNKTDDETDAYIKELNGINYDASAYVYPFQTTDGYTVVSHTILLNKPVDKKLTITPGGKQVVWVIKLNGYIQKDTGKPGDVNEDDVTDVTDVMCMVNYILGNEVTPFNEANADVNNDGLIDVTDVMCTVDIILNGNTQQ